VICGVLALRAALCSICQRVPDFISGRTLFFYEASISNRGRGLLAINRHRRNDAGHLPLVQPNDVKSMLIR
jgi:hypothetical protein